LGFSSRESDGSFQYGYYWREAEDLHAVTQHFHESNRRVNAVVGHSKGILASSPYLQVFLLPARIFFEETFKDCILDIVADFVIIHQICSII
jgi:hypothetical protein